MAGFPNVSLDCSIRDILLIDFEAKLIKFLTDSLITWNAISSERTDAIGGQKTDCDGFLSPLWYPIIFGNIGFDFGLVFHENNRSFFVDGSEK